MVLKIHIDLSALENFGKRHSYSGKINAQGQCFPILGGPSG